MAPILFLRNTGLAKTGEICGFDQRADLRLSPRFDCPQPGDAGVTIVTYQTARFGELCSSAVVVAFESMGSGQKGAELGVCRCGVACSLAPNNGLLEA